MKKIWKFLSSMRFALILLVVLILACVAGSLIPQGQTLAWYSARYSERAAAFIVALRLDDAFHSPVFIALAGFLCLNLLLCNVLRLPELLRRTRAAADPARVLGLPGDVQADDIEDPEAALRALGVRRPVPVGKNALFGVKHRAGLWGAWVCHLGVLLLILGFGLGQMTQVKYAAYGVPGQSRPIGDTGYMLGIDDFQISLREDDTVEQYTADITVYDVKSGDGRGQSAEISVNHPATLYGMKFYQNSTGWAADVNVTKDGQPLTTAVLCAGETLPVPDKPELVICLNAFYPDYVLVPGSGPSTASAKLNNPAYLYSVFYQGQLLGMNALMEGEELTIDEYAVTFSNPQSYTMIQVKADRFAWLALLGGLVTLLGLFLAFYLQPAQLWATRDDSARSWTLHGRSPKGGVLFRERFEEEGRKRH